jgi:hypothetical protein
MTTETTEAQLWNEAYDRLESYLRTFDLGDILQKARDLHRSDATRNPTQLTLELTQKSLADWLATNLDPSDTSPSYILPSGYIAILLSRAYCNAPKAFLTGPLPEEMRHALRETLLVTGPDLNVSSMTPRHLDYGPMLQFARQTWHRLDVKEFLIAVAFWGAVYTVFYWWLSKVL